MTTNTNSQTTTATALPILVLGGTGKTGRRVAERLTAQGREVRIGSRSAAVPFDWEKPETWAAAVEGVSAVYVAYSPDAGFPGAAEVVGAFAAVAAAAGAYRLVLLTGRGEAGAVLTEEAVRAVPGVRLTVVRAAFFAQNFSEDFLAEGVAAGAVAFPAGQTAEPFIDVEDIADVAVAALLDESHAGQVYELTGPRLLTFADAAREIGEATGREVAYVPLTAEQFLHGAIEQGLPADFAGLLTDLFVELLDGHNSYVTGDVRKVLGREPRDFTAYARQTAAAGVWG